MPIQDYGEIYNILWHTDENGNKISILRQNENYVVVNNKILLNEIPDRFYKVQIADMYEIPYSQEIAAENLYKVNYLTGEVCFHSNKEGQTITVAQYYGKGIIKSYAIRTFLQDTNNNWESETLEDLAEEIKQYIDSNRSELDSDIENLQTQITTNENDIETKLSNHQNSTTAHNSNNIVNGSSVTGNNVSEAINNLKTIVDNITTVDSNANIGVYSATDNINTNNYVVTISGLTYFGGLKVNLTVTNANTDTATLDINGLGAKTIKIRKSDGTKVDAPAGSVKGIVQLEYDGTDFILINGEVEEYSPELTQNSSIFTLGTGKDENGQDVDISSSVTEGQVSATLKSNTATNIVKNGNFADGINGWSVDYATLSASNNTLSITCDGTGIIGIATQNTNIPYVSGKKIYVRGKLRVLNSDARQIRIRLIDENNLDNVINIVIETPNANEWYEINEIVTLNATGGNLQIQLYHRYPDAETANGKVMEVQEVFALDLTAHGLDDKIADEINEMFPYWFDGTKSTNSVRLKVVGKNLFDASKAIIGKALSSTGGITNTGDYDFLSPDILVKPSSDYILKVNGIVAETNAGRVSFLDASKNHILTTNTIPDVNSGYTFTTPENCRYIRFYIRKDNSEAISDIYSFKTQLEPGDTATEYEPYKESVSYITLPQGVDGLHSLSNGTKDEVTDAGKLIKRTKRYVLQSSDIIYLDNGTNVQRVRFNKPSDSIVKGDISNNIIGAMSMEGYTENTTATWDDSQYEFTFTNRYSTDLVILSVPLGTYADLAEAQADLSGTTLIYQLAEPIEYQLEGFTPLNSYPKGTLIVEPYLKKAIKYDATTGNGLDFPIALSEIEKIEDINGNEIDLSTVTLASDGLSATISGASDGEVYTVYGYIKPEESTIPETVHKAPINTKATIKDNNAMIQKHSKNILDLQDQVAMLIVLNS